MNQFLKFEPILKEKIWGGKRLASLGKHLKSENTGESWEISDVEGDTSIVANGHLKGRNIKDLIKEYKGALVGDAIYAIFGDKFPLLIKFIDAREALSIQLHPHNDLAQQRHNSFGKTEMWYIMQADEKANLIMGFQNDSSKEEYLHHLNNKSLLEILNVDEVEKGDVYFIPTGRIHAIGAGVMLAEIKQTSDITYRVYDWDRQDDQRNYRDLHTEQAIDAIDYSAEKSYKTEYQKNQNRSSEIVSCPYFTTNILPVEGKIAIDHKDKSSFFIYLCVAGKVTFLYQNSGMSLQMGETIMVPASIKDFTIASSINSELLEVYIK